ncbi:replication protein RepA [Sphingobium chungbukense]|uniref:Pirin n=1 Tax=Sphingobium chungbukense TaxID=56193 RepID=A0A0M3ALB6_9SPHN|nr:replication protein RepA [Sphingobium chungbukense]KKW89726.1 pirin [Sphingobium chungbukense]
MAAKEFRPAGHQFALSFIDGGRDAVERTLIDHVEADVLRSAFLNVQDEDPVPAYLHSALCAMSLPTQKPKDEFQPIIRSDDRYALAINPKPVLQMLPNGERAMVSKGVPYGAYPRVVLIYLLSEAVRHKSRDVYLGRNFADWMRKLGYANLSYGKRGSAHRMLDQIDRLLACEWQIRWDSEPAKGEDGSWAFREAKLTHEQAGTEFSDGSFRREIRLSETFYSHLLEHSVPLNEVAIRALKEKPTALDLYTYLAYRLPRVKSPAGQRLTYDQLAKHLGNDAVPGKFKQAVMRSIDLVTSVYPNANVQFGKHEIRLMPSPEPMAKKLIGSHLRLVGASKAGSGKEVANFEPRSSVPKDKIAPASGNAQLAEKQPFPGGSIRYSPSLAAFREIATRRGGGYDMDDIVAAFRKGMRDIHEAKSQETWLALFSRFCEAYATKRNGD